MRGWMGCVALGAVLAVACGSDDEPAGGGSGGSAGTGGTAGVAGSAGGGAAGSAGGTSLAAVCVKSPVPAGFAGTTACPTAVPGSADTLDAALTQAGVDRCTYGFSDDTMSIWKPIFADDPYQLPDFRPLHAGLLRLPPYASETESWLSAAFDGQQVVSSALAALSQRRGQPLEGCMELSTYDGVLDAPAPLAAALALFIQSHGGAADRAALENQLAGVPSALQVALVRIVAALDVAAHEIVASWGTSDPEELEWLERTHGFVLPPPLPFTVDAQKVALLDKVDHARMALAAAQVARAVEDAKLESFAGIELTAVTVDTPIGAFVLSGPGADQHAEGEPAASSAFLLDVGGDDVYTAPVAAGRRDVPVSVAVDLGGKDQYGYEVVADPFDKPTRPPSDSAGRSTALGSFGQTLSRVGRQGSGVLGVGLAFDLGVEADTYRSLTLSQGAGAQGVGVLYDAGGDDEYVAEVMSQGAALWGLGVLLDRGGSDSYRTFSFSQGFAYVQGHGTLADNAGDDVYFADPGDPAIGGDPLYPSAQLPNEGNTSFVQGAAFGRRDDTNELYMGGGFGVLFDRLGNDAYTASVFAQGTGYWLGFGMLSDAAGDDSYKGLWYVQGASAHFALALHVDRAGNDRYNEGFPVRATSIGVGHDFSGALQIDLAGDDQYWAPGLSLGCGNSQGIGGLINVAGVDSYAATGKNTVGCASIGHGPPFDTTRDVRPTIGVFVDASSADTYTLPAGSPGATDDSNWSLSVQKAQQATAPDSEHSGGVDQPNGSVSLP